MKALCAAVALIILAQANETNAAELFAAIAVSSSGKSGQSWNFPTQAAAEARALAECRQVGPDCKVANWAKNACVAIAVDGSTWGAAWSEIKEEASKKAIDSCKSNGGVNCTVDSAICTKNASGVARSADCESAYAQWQPQATRNRAICAGRPLTTRCVNMNKEGIAIYARILARCERQLSENDVQNLNTNLRVIKKALAGGYNYRGGDGGSGGYSAAPRQGLSNRGIPCFMPSEKVLGGC
jgi:hypothetical protein